MALGAKGLFYCCIGRSTGLLDNVLFVQFIAFPLSFFSLNKSHDMLPRQLLIQEMHATETCFVDYELGGHGIDRSG